MSEFSTLTAPGIIGNYKSAKLTLVILHNRKSKENTLIIARVCMQDSDIKKPKPDPKKGNLNEDYGFAVIDYDVELTVAEKIFAGLLNEDKWIDPCGHSLTTDKGLKALDRKYAGANPGTRENNFLSACETGSYWIEFFNERKQTVSLIYDPYREGLLANLAPIVNTHCNIDLNKCQDRIGNIIFQFPITVVKIAFKGREKELSVTLDWQIPAEEVPDGFIQAESKDENALIDFVIQPFTGNSATIIPVKSFDTTLMVRIMRKDPDLILQEWNCGCGRITDLYVTMTHDQPTIREFYIGATPQQTILHFRNSVYNPLHHLEHSKIAIARSNLKKSYRQFGAGDHSEAVEYLRQLVRQSGAPEILMIDPYLVADDIMNILYFSTLFGRPLRAIGSASTEIPGLVVSTTGNAAATVQPGRAATKITEQRSLLSDPRNNNVGLNLEFRMQFGGHGRSMHDRFLLFTGSAEDHAEPQAYSIGTSFNGIGKSYHVIGALEGAQSIIDDFEIQWKLLEHPECLVFKYPVQ